MLWAPNELGFARAYVSGDVQVDGDMLAGLEALERVALPENGPGVVVDKATKKALLKAALKLSVLGPPPKPPKEEARVEGRRHSKRRDAEAIAHHYDVGNDFYRIVLGESMTYSCAYWEREPGPSFGLADAQLAKCDLVARKLNLSAWHAGARCRLRLGNLRHARREDPTAPAWWGSPSPANRLTTPASGSPKRASATSSRSASRTIATSPTGPYDAISSIGMAEHVGRSDAGDLRRRSLRAASAGGAAAQPRHRTTTRARMSRRSIRRCRSSTVTSSRMASCEPLAAMVGALEGAGFRGA